MTDTRPPEQRRNSGNDEDWIQALQEVEEITVGESEDLKERYKSDAATIREKAKRKKKMLCAELGLDAEVFDAMLADRAEDRKYEAAKAKRAAKMADSKVEYFLDALGQYAWIEPAEPVAGQEPESVAERAARERIEAIQKVTDEEQAEGAAVLDQLASSEAAH